MVSKNTDNPGRFCHPMFPFYLFLQFQNSVQGNLYASLYSDAATQEGCLTVEREFRALEGKV